MAYGEFVEGYEVVFRPILQTNVREYMGYAMWFYQSLGPRSFPAVQLVWPSSAGLYPWDKGCPIGYLDLQEKLWEPQR